MDLKVIEGLNEVVPVVYRAAFKLRSLQRLCQMHMVTLAVICPTLQSLGVAVCPRGGVTEADMRRSLEQLFQGVSQDLPGQVPPEAAEQTSRLLFRLFDRGQTGCISLQSVEVALTALSGDTLSAKHNALYQMAERCSGRQGRESGTVSRSGLRALLEDLSQIPAAVQEGQVFGPVESAVRSCFQGVLGAGVSEEAFLRWLRSEPRLLLWLSTLYRISVSESVLHHVRCHVCHTSPITGLRYRCLKCVNVHLCQTCFLTHKHGRKHKPSHPVMEHCTQPSFRESLSSLAHSARNALRRRRLAGREALSTDSLPSMPCSAPTASLMSQTPPPEPEATPTEPRLKSKAQQTDSAPQLQRKTSLLKKDLSQTRMAVRDLQRDKWLLEKQLQVWRAAVQTEHSSLEDKCCHLEATVEVLTQHNQNLQDQLDHMLVQPLRTSPVPGVSLVTASNERATETPALAMAETESARPLQEEQAPAEDTGQEGCVSDRGAEPKAARTPDAPGPLPLATSDPRCGEEPAHREEDQEHAGKTLLGQSESCLEQEEELADLVLRLKSALSTDRRTGFDSAQKLDLLAAAEAVEDSISQLVCAVCPSGLLPRPRLHTPGQPQGPTFSTNQAVALGQLRSQCTQWSSSRNCNHSSLIAGALDCDQEGALCPMPLSEVASGFSSV